MTSYNDERDACLEDAATHLERKARGPKKITYYAPREVQEDAAKARKAQPVVTGFLDLFPDAVRAAANVSVVAMQQHNLPTLMWDRSKSTDDADALARHLQERGKLDTDGVRHSAKVLWRAAAMLQREIEAERRALNPYGPAVDNQRKYEASVDEPIAKREMTPAEKRNISYTVKPVPPSQYGGSE